MRGASLVKCAAWKGWLWCCVPSAQFCLFFCAGRLRQKRLRLAIPAAVLGLLALYELYMIHWERTVVAPIRIDLFLEIPMMLVAWTWGILALILSSRSSQA
jgi:putative effector of murein hydrolase LrgA (UPF0299 family)